MITPQTQGADLTAAGLPPHVMLTVIICADVLVLLLYAGIALPAVWSAKPARRKAAAEILRQILTVITAISGRTMDR
jgi:hypothetical protein